MWTLAFRTRGGEPEHFRGFQGGAHLKDFRCCWEILAEILEHGSRPIALDHAKHPALIHSGLRARTKFCHWLFLFFESNRLDYGRDSKDHMPSDGKDGPFRTRSSSCSCEHFGMCVGNVRGNLGSKRL